MSAPSRPEAAGERGAARWGAPTRPDHGLATDLGGRFRIRTLRRPRHGVRDDDRLAVAAHTDRKRRRQAFQPAIDPAINAA